MVVLPLPPEITIIIAEYLEPTFCLNFALTCTEAWGLCRSVLEDHRRAFVVHESIDVTNTGLRKKLKNVILDPQHGWYHRELRLPDCWESWEDPEDDDCEMFIAEFERIEALYKSVENDDCWLKTPRDYTPDHVPAQSPYIDPIITVLVHHLPNLKTFRFVGLNVGGVLWEMTRLSILVRTIAPIQLAVRLPFRHLTTVALCSGADEEYCSADWVLLFIRIPSLRKLVAEKLGNDATDSIIEEAETSIEVPESNVKELLFVNSRLAPGTLRNILADIGALERFSYALSDMLRYSLELWSQCIQWLCVYARDSLQHLVLEVPMHYYSGDTGGLTSQPQERDAPPILSPMSLRGFRKLKTLKIEWSILWTNSITPSAMANYLPDSLEAFHLSGWFYGPSEWGRVNTDLDRLFHAMPNLKSIYAKDRVTASEYSKMRRKKTINAATAKLPGTQENPLIGLLNG